MTEINSGLNYSPKLKEAMAEIKAIIIKHDIAAHVLLHEPGFSEYLLEIEPCWSILKLEKKGIRIRSKLEDFAGDRDAQRKASEDTTSLIRHFADLLARDSEIFEQIYKMLLKHWDITHSKGIHTGHRYN
jgi:hypothetical protein